MTPLRDYISNSATSVCPNGSSDDLFCCIVSPLGKSPVVQNVSGESLCGVIFRRENSQIWLSGSVPCSLSSLPSSLQERNKRCRPISAQPVSLGTSTAGCDPVPERAGRPGQRRRRPAGQSQPRFPGPILSLGWATRSSRQPALRHRGSEQLENGDLRLRSRSSLESRRAREVQSAGQQR